MLLKWPGAERWTWMYYMMYICIYVYIQIRLSISFYIYIILHLYLYLYLCNIDMASRLTAFSIFSYFVDDITSVDSQKFAGLNPRENVPRGSGCWYPCGFVVCVWYCLGAKSCQRRSCQKLGLVNGPNITRLLGRQSPTGTWKWCSKSPKQDPIIILSCHKWLEKQDLSNNHLGYHQAHMVSLLRRPSIGRFGCSQVLDTSNY